MNLVNILQRKNHAEIHLVTNHEKQQSNSMSTFFWVLQEYLQTQKGFEVHFSFCKINARSNKRRSKTEYKNIILSNGAMLSDRKVFTNSFPNSIIILAFLKGCDSSQKYSDYVSNRKSKLADFIFISMHIRLTTKYFQKHQTQVKKICESAFRTLDIL